MAEEKIQGIGSPISTSVVDQINVRKSVIGKTNGRTSNELLFANSNTGWIRLSSGVNTITEEETAQLRRQEGRNVIKGDSTKAGYNILQGGLLAPDRKLRAGIDTTGTYNQSSAYNNRMLSTGIRPMPGINSMTVMSKNTLGTLREATVQISVWSLEDFELIEELYLRPGFTMLLEWGHSLYYNNNKDLIKSIRSIPNKFFQAGVTMTSVLSWIDTIRRASSYNYEAMIGYVRNFSWEYRANGEYSCTVTIVSTGEVLESLKVNLDPIARGIPKKETLQPTTEEGKEQRKSVIHFFASKLESIRKPQWTLEDLKLQTPSMGNTLQPFTGYYSNVDYKAAGNLFFDDSIPTHWIPLRTLLDIINNYISLVDQTKLRNSVDRNYVKFNIDFTKSSKYLTHKDHFSIDPTVCILPYKTPSNLGVVNAVHNNIGKLENGYDDVLNILISVPYIKQLFDTSLDDKQGMSKSIGDILEELLNAVSTALGGVNDLDIAYDEEDGRGAYYVVDRNNTAQTENIPVLSLAGSDSIFTEISISSKISNEISSQIAIAAQGSSQNTTENIENILRWNVGVIDRLNVTKDLSDKEKSNINEVKKDIEERTEEWITAVQEFFQAFNTVGWKDEQLEAAKTLHREVTVQGIKDTKYQNAQPLPGIVPVELSFRLDGIGGLKIGECFKIADGILPKKYTNRFGYIITGLEHSITDSNRWETLVRTSFYSIEKTTPGEAVNAEYEILEDRRAQTGTQVSTGGTWTSTPSFSIQSCLDDAKVQISPNYNLAQLSCKTYVARTSIPAPGQFIQHQTYGRLGREDIIENLKNLAKFVLEPIRQRYPTVIVTNAYRNVNGRSQHDAGMAADIQFADIAGSLSAQNAAFAERAIEIKKLLKGNYDQFLLEYKTTRGGRPWIHISYNKTKNRNEASTFLNDKYAAKGRNNLYNPLV